MKIIKDSRYEEAQKYEKTYWDYRQHDPIGILVDLGSTLALSQHMQRESLINKYYNRVIDIGVGALGIGMLFFINSKEKIGLDPLDILPPITHNECMDEFVKNAQKGNIYIKAKAEEIPFESSYFDLVICNNVLDHTHNPYKILEEIYRILRKDGIFGFSVDTYSLVGYLNRKIGKIINPNSRNYPGHPYDWMERQMFSILKEHRFNIISHRQRTIKGRILGRRRRSTWICSK